MECFSVWLLLRKNGVHFVNGPLVQVETVGILTLRVVLIKGCALPVC